MKRKKKVDLRENVILLFMGMMSLAVGLFLFADAICVHTMSYDELVESSVVVREVEYSYGKYHFFTIEDTEGKQYNIDGEYDWGLEEWVQPGKTIAIRYQPAYYRFENGIQELCLDGERLVTYRNDDAGIRIGFPIIGGFMVLFAGVMCAMATLEMRREVRRRNKRNIKLRRKYGNKTKTS